MCKFKFLHLVAIISCVVFSSIADDGIKDEKTFEENLKLNKKPSPQKFEEYLVNFMLFTRSNPDKFFLLQTENPQSIQRSFFDPSKDTKIVIHGWRNDGFTSNFSTMVRDAFLELYDANVICVDWSTQSHMNYISSRMDVTNVAGVVTKLVDTLVRYYGVESSRIHIVGHSLGAHVAGIAGFSLKTGNVSRITGLDPALPLFTVYQDNRIRPDSADFVDIIHSCGNLLGFKTALGQVDFYPNGGTFEQPGCGFDYKGKCSHGRSYMFFVESMRYPNNFMAAKCDNYDAFDKKNCDPDTIPMGEYTPRTARGKYYLTTNAASPFGRGDVVFPVDPHDEPEYPGDDIVDLYD